MLDHWTRLRKAKKALDDGAFEEAYRLAQDPLVREHVRARKIRGDALRALVDRARRHREKGNFTEAQRDLQVVLSAAEPPEESVAMARELEETIRLAAEASRRECEAAEQAEREIETGFLREARARLSASQGSGPRRKALLARIDERIAMGDAHVAAARRALEQGQIFEAEHECEQAARIDPRREDLAALRQSCAAARRRRTVDEIEKRAGGGDLQGAWALVANGIEADPALALDSRVAATAARHADALLGEAEVALERGTLVELEDLLRSLRSIRIDRPGRADLARAATLWRRGDDLVAQGEIEVGEGLLRVAAEISPGSRGIRASLARATGLHDALEARIAEAVRHLERGDPDAAAKVLDSVSAEVPQHRYLDAFRAGVERARKGREASLGEARAALAQGRIEEGVEASVAVWARTGDRSGAEPILADAAGRRDRATRDLLEAEGRCAGPEPSREDLTECLRRTEAVLGVDAGSKAARERKRAVETELTVRDRLDWGEVHERRGEWREARRWYREGLQLVPDHDLCTSRVRGVTAKLAAELLAEAEEDFRTGRWPEARERIEAIAELTEAPAEIRIRSEEIRRRIEEGEKEASKLEGEARGLLEEGRSVEARRVLEHLFAVFPGHRGGCDLRELADRYERFRGEIDAIEGDLRGGFGIVLEDCLRRAEALPGDLPRVQALKDEARRRSAFQQRFVIRVEEGTDTLVLSGDVVRIGNALGQDNDLAILANLSTRHAEIIRARSFHGGVRYELRACSGRDCSVNGRTIDAAPLEDGDTVRLGEDLGIDFHLPSAKSRTARLRLAEGFDVEGIREILLMAPSGKEGRILLGPGPGCHITAPRAPREIEIFRVAQGSRAGELVCRSTAGVLVDGRGGRTEERLYPGCVVECGSCRFTVDAS